MLDSKPRILYATATGPIGGGGNPPSFPDVTSVPPAIPGPVPIPYPNVGTDEHRVQDSDHLSSISIKNGYRDWKTLWNENPGIQSKRKNPHILFNGDNTAPGDVVKLPTIIPKQETGATEMEHPFVVPNSDLCIRFQVLDEKYAPVKEADYELNVGGQVTKGKTDVQGRLTDSKGSTEIIIPHSAQQGNLVVWPKPDPPEAPATPQAGPTPSPTTSTATTSAPAASEPPLELRFQLQIGALNPIQEMAPDLNCISGVQARLNNLGFECGPVDGVNGPVTTAAIQRFQQRAGLMPVDGIPGPITQAKLHELHDTDATDWPPIKDVAQGEVGKMTAPIESGGGGEPESVTGIPDKTKGLSKH